MKGFTLIELLVVIAIIGILTAGIVLSTMGNYEEKGDCSSQKVENWSH